MLTGTSSKVRYVCPLMPAQESKLVRMDQEVNTKLKKVLRLKAKQAAIANKVVDRALHSTFVPVVASKLNTDSDEEEARNDRDRFGMSTMYTQNTRNRHNNTVLNTPTKPPEPKRKPRYMTNTINLEIKTMATYLDDPARSPRFKTPCPRPQCLH